MIRSGKIKLDINPEKQNRHLLGRKSYEEYKLKNLKNGKATPSFTLLTSDELNSLIIQKSGSGRLITDSKEKWKNKEIIDFGKIIGKDYIEGQI